MIANRRRTLLFGSGITYGPPADTYTGSYAGRASGVAGWLFVDLDMVLAAGAKISHLHLYEAIAFGHALCIMRRDDAANFTCIKRIDVTSSTTGWQAFALASEYIIPNDGKAYHVGIANTGGNSPCIVGVSRTRAYRTAVLAEGAQGACTVDYGSGVCMGYRGSLLA